MTGTARDERWPEVLDEVTGALESLTAALIVEEDFAILLHQVCAQVKAAVPGVDEASITLLRESCPMTVASTSDVVAELDHDQYACGDGPCVRAAATGQLVRMSISEAARRWPQFAGDAERAGYGSFLSAPLVVEDGYSGAVNCYSASGHGFVELDERLLDLYSGIATAVLRIHSRYIRARDTADTLTHALTSRAIIDQAKGILMAMHRIGADEAFTLLADQSQRENVKLRDIATRFVTQVTTPHS